MHQIDEEQRKSLQELQRQLQEIENNDLEFCTCSNALEVKATILDVVSERIAESNEMEKLHQQMMYDVCILKQRKRTLLDQYMDVDAGSDAALFPIEYLSSRCIKQICHYMDREQCSVDEAVYLYQTEQFRAMRIELHGLSPRKIVREMDSFIENF